MIESKPAKTLAYARKHLVVKMHKTPFSNILIKKAHVLQSVVCTFNVFLSKVCFCEYIAPQRGAPYVSAPSDPPPQCDGTSRKTAIANKRTSLLL